MDSFDISRVIYLLIILLLFVPGWWVVAKRDNKALRNAIVWFVIIVALALGWAVFHPQSFPIPMHPSGVSHEI